MSPCTPLLFFTSPRHVHPPAIAAASERQRHRRGGPSGCQRRLELAEDDEEGKVAEKGDHRGEAGPVTCRAANWVDLVGYLIVMIRLN